MMDTQNAPLVMYIHDGTRLEVDCDLNLTIDGEVPEPDEVVDFLIEFARDSMKEPLNPDKSMMDLVKEIAIEEETKRTMKKRRKRK